MREQESFMVWQATTGCMIEFIKKGQATHNLCNCDRVLSRKLPPEHKRVGSADLVPSGVQPGKYWKYILRCNFMHTGTQPKGLSTLNNNKNNKNINCYWVADL